MSYDSIINEGTINANTSGVTLTVGGSGGTLISYGTISSSGTMELCQVRSMSCSWVSTE